VCRTPARACAAADGAAAPRAEFDPIAIPRYAAATALQLGLMVLTMAALDAFLLPQLSPALARVAAGAWFAFNSLRSRIFSPLDNRRPKLRRGGAGLRTRPRAR
jgi:hypothetical protein